MGAPNSENPDDPGQSGASRREARHHRSGQRRSRRRVALTALGAVAVVGIGAAGGAAAWTVGHYGGNIATVGATFPTGDRPPAAAPDAAGSAPLTFALVGVDPGSASEAGSTAESVTLVRLTADKQDAQLVSFPLDTWVADAGRPGTTLEAAYGDGDRPGLVQALETLTDVRIDHYAELDFAGFRSTIDAVGGVDVDVPEAYANRGYTFEPGVQHLDGAAALAYVRDAAGDGAHRETTDRQHQVVAALVRAVSAQGVGDLGTMTGTVESLTRSLTVDDTLGRTDLAQLAWGMRGVEQPEFLSVPVSGTGTEAGTEVQYVDPARSAALWQYLSTDSLAEHVDEFR